jgi:hypothetical protein
VLAFASATDPWVWAKAGAAVALIDLAHGSIEAAHPGDPRSGRWMRTTLVGAVAAASAGLVALATGAAPGGLVVRIVALGALATSLVLLFLLVRPRQVAVERRPGEPPLRSGR